MSTCITCRFWDGPTEDEYELCRVEYQNAYAARHKPAAPLSRVETDAMDSALLKAQRTLGFMAEGACHRHAPTILTLSSEEFRAQAEEHPEDPYWYERRPGCWPRTDREDWCGEHQPRE